MTMTTNKEDSDLENYLDYCGCKDLKESVAMICLQECASNGMTKSDDDAKTKRQSSSDGTDPLAALGSRSWKHFVKASS